MKTKSLLTLLLFCFAFQLLAQPHPLVGTWEVVSIKATQDDGTKLTATGSEFKETKIINANHYVLITFIKQGDSLLFNKAIAGRVRVEGNKYIEIPEYASDPNILKEKTNFTYRLEGDKFIQSGTYTSADGKTGKLDELVFQKVKEDKVNSPITGSWKHIQSSSYENASGFEIDTPTQWLGIYFKDKKFESAGGGAYTIEGKKAIFNIKHSSTKSEEGTTVDHTYHLQGDKVTYTGHILGKDGKKLKPVREVFQRVDTKAKTASTK